MTELTHFVFDLETLDVLPTAVILTMACVPLIFEQRGSFESYMRAGFFVKLDVKSQWKKYQRTISKSTLEFWKKQDAEVQKLNLIPDALLDLDLREALLGLGQFMSETSGFNYKESYIWVRGPHFDIPILSDAYRSVNLTEPYSHWKVRDVRTYIDIMAGTNIGYYDFIPEYTDPTIRRLKHDCLHDAARDAAMMNELYHQSI